jgi:predicted lysophospholipase L1 biosynthesis ABC-type transport system permease subunit
MFSGTVAVVSSIVAILVSGLILFGAIKMKRLESYGLAMAVSIIAMIPCFSPCCLIGLPIGIWAMVVLSKPEVKSAFH